MTHRRPPVPSDALRAPGPRGRLGAAVLLVPAVLAVGCSRTGPEGVADGADAERPPSLEAPDGPGTDAPGTDAATAGTGDVAAGLDDAIAIAVADAAGTAGTSEASITVISAEYVTWPDGSLGCPEPGMAYTQALVDGYRIVLEVADAPVAYHGALDSPPLRCEDPVPPIEDGRG
jgi:hypothetical protein